MGSAPDSRDPEQSCTPLTDRWVYTTIACMSSLNRDSGRLIYNRLSTLRAERDLSRTQLADLVGVNPQTIGALERGDHYPSLDLAMRLCEVFRLPVEAIFSRAPFEPLSNQIYRARGGRE